LIGLEHINIQFTCSHDILTLTVTTIYKPWE